MAEEKGDKKRKPRIWCGVCRVWIRSAPCRCCGWVYMKRRRCLTPGIKHR